MKVKLNSNQEEKLVRAINKENAYKQQLQIAQTQFNEAARARQDIFEMICDAEKVDLRKVDTQRIQVKDHTLVLTDTTPASKRIKEELKKSKFNGHATNKAKS